jgi:hypothetical protein
MTTLTIPLAKKEIEHLKRLALRYGLSLPEFSRLVLKELATSFPEDSFENYDNPQALKASFKRALKDWKKGRVSETL